MPIEDLDFRSYVKEGESTPALQSSRLQPLGRRHSDPFDSPQSKRGLAGKGLAK